MKYIVKIVPCAAICFMPLAIVRAADPAPQSLVKYEPTVESLRQAEVPEWFIDG